jgi:nicotinamidase-related amidase
MQNLFAPGGPWATPWMEKALPSIKRLAGHAPERTVFTRFIPPADASEANGMWRAYYRKWSTVTRDRLNPDLMELVPELRGFVPPASVIDRMVYSAFGGGRLLGFLSKHHVDTLIISGGETDVCVLSTVLSAIDLGYRIILVEGALCSSSHESSMRFSASIVIGLISRSVLQTSNISSVFGSRPKTACTRLRDAASEARTLTPAHSDCASYLYPTRPGQPRLGTCRRVRRL